jgi:type 2A phosphatase activator TIP41
VRAVVQGGPVWEAAEAGCIDREMLQSREPILFYDDVTLYEDELHDHGVVQLNVKVRVMPR